jgi:hypothetical protein
MLGGGNLWILFGISRILSVIWSVLAPGFTVFGSISTSLLPSANVVTSLTSPPKIGQRTSECLIPASPKMNTTNTALKASALPLLPLTHCNTAPTNWEGDRRGDIGIGSRSPAIVQKFLDSSQGRCRVY